MFSEFVNIWKADKSTEKKKAHKMFYFIFLLCDLTELNPIKDTPAFKKEEEALYRAYGKRDHKFTSAELKLIEPAVKCYIRYNQMPEERILVAFDTKAEDLRSTLENTVPETEENVADGITNFVSNSSIITKGLQELESVKRIRISVISSIKKDAMTQKVRGQVSLSPLSKGNIELPDFTEIFT